MSEQTPSTVEQIIAAYVTSFDDGLSIEGHYVEVSDGSPARLAIEAHDAEDAAMRAAFAQMLTTLCESAAHMESLAKRLPSAADKNALEARARQARTAIAAAEAVTR